MLTYLEVQVVPVLPSVLPLQKTQGDHHDLVCHLVHLTAQLHKECRSLYFLHHLKCQHSSGFYELEQLLHILCNCAYAQKKYL